jgi:AbrB family looped-hinge helix DNA binding protein
MAQSREVGNTGTYEVTMGRQGRVVVPPALRDQLGIEPGETLIARVDDNQLVLETRRAILARLQREFSSVAPERDLVAELIAERREEARREAEQAEEDSRSLQDAP